MNFPPKPSYSNRQIDEAGEIIRIHGPRTPQGREVFKVINAWRISHEYPMHTFNVTLRRNAKQVYSDAVVARRLKRLQTIIDKIGNRERHMKLSRMQDIGGVRAIMQNVGQVQQLRNIYLEPGRFPHKLKSEKDYITSPQSSGYRGIHLVFGFYNSRGRQPHSRCWDGLNIEIQLRTELQHAWATGVEIVGTMRRENLKSGQGDREWLQLFEYLASIIALLEDSPTLTKHKDMTTQALFQRTHELSLKLDARKQLKAWLAVMVASGAIKLANKPPKDYYYNILTIDSDNHKINITGFKRDHLSEANERLAELEQRNPELQPVLVAAGDMTSLKRAYPNYLLDAEKLLIILDDIEKTVQSGL